QAQWNHRRWRGHQLGRDRDGRGRLAEEGRNSVFELRAPDADIDELRACRLQLCFRLCDIRTGGDAGCKSVLGQLQRLLEQRHCTSQQVGVRVQAVEFKVDLGELCLIR